jgi:16S rRNA G966 N2-methylase RsmD
MRNQLGIPTYELFKLRKLPANPIRRLRPFIDLVRKVAIFNAIATAIIKKANGNRLNADNSHVSV